MTARARRRRALVLVCLSIACGGLAASQVRGRVREVESRVGASVPVVVARADVQGGTRLTPARVRRLLAVRGVPEAFAPPDSLADAAEAEGLRTAASLAAGSYLTAGHLDAGERARDGGPSLRAGERAVEVSAAGGESLGGAGPGGRVDVLVTSETSDGAGRTYLALEDVELLAIRAGEAAAPRDDESGAGERTIATLRVTLRQAVFLTAAQSFAREVRLLPRPAGDRRHARAPVASAGR